MWPNGGDHPHSKDGAFWLKILVSLIVIGLIKIEINPLSRY